MLKYKFTPSILIITILFCVNTASAQTADPSWSSYSSGLYYKNLALESKTGAAGREYILKAIDFFHQAEGNIPDDEKYTVYSELADAYYYAGDIEKSLSYAEKSISLKIDYLNPYNRLFNIYINRREHKKAAEVLEKYLGIRPESVYIRFILAEHYYSNLGDAAKSETNLKEVIKYSVSNQVENYYIENTYYLLGNLALAKNQMDEAANYYSKSLEINGNNTNSLYMLAILNMNIYKLEKAEANARSYLQKFPDNSEINGIIGRIKYINGAPSAMTYLYKASANNSPNGILCRALYYEMIGSRDAAEKIQKKLELTNPEYAEIHISLGNIYQKKGDSNTAFSEYADAALIFFNNGLYVKALEFFTKAEKIDNSYPEIFSYKAKIYEYEGNIPMAIFSYNKFLNLKLDINIILYTGYLYAAKGDFKSAFEYFNWARQINPENSLSYFYAGLAHIWNENYSEAEISIKAAIELQSDDETYFFYLAVAQEKLKKIDDTIKSIETAIRLNPASGRSNNFLGYLYADMGINLEKSRELITKALEAEPDNAAYIDSLGWLLYREKNFNEALVHLIRAEKILKDTNSEDSEVYGHLGDTYRSIGDIDKALLYWEKSQKIKWSAETDKKIKDGKK